MNKKSDMNGMEAAEPYIELFSELRNRVGDDAVALGIMHEVAKDRRGALMRAERQARLDDFEQESGDDEAEDQPSERPNSRNRPASAKQIEYIRKLGGAPGVNLSSYEASEMIDQLLARRNERERA